MSDPSIARLPTALRVSATLMTLEAGIYCVFGASGVGGADAASGLPAVRLSAAPGVAGGKVEIVGFGAEGWLTRESNAALLRVAGGAAEVMVTVYQAAGSTHEPPKLQVLRLNDGGSAPGIPVPPDAVPEGPIEAMAHVYGIGDVGGRFGAWIGERGSRRWIEGFALQSLRLTVPGELEYQAVLGRGWMSPWAEAGQFCGSRRMSLPVLGLHVRLRGAAAAAFDLDVSAAFDLDVSATFVDGTVVGPVRDVPCESPSLAALEAFQVMLVPKEMPGR